MTDRERWRQDALSRLDDRVLALLAVVPDVPVEVCIAFANAEVDIMEDLLFGRPGPAPIGILGILGRSPLQTLQEKQLEQRPLLPDS